MAYEGLEQVCKEKTVAELASIFGKTERGVKSVLTRRGLYCKDHNRKGGGVVKQPVQRPQYDKSTYYRIENNPLYNQAIRVKDKDGNVFTGILINTYGDEKGIKMGVIFAQVINGVIQQPVAKRTVFRLDPEHVTLDLVWWDKKEKSRK